MSVTIGHTTFHRIRYARWSLDREGEVRITFPDGQVLTAGREDLAPALASSAA